MSTLEVELQFGTLGQFNKSTKQNNNFQREVRISRKEESKRTKIKENIYKDTSWEKKTLKI